MMHIVQSGYYKLTRKLFLDALPRNLSLCAALFVLTWGLLLRSANGSKSVMAFETLMDTAYIHITFMCILALSVILRALDIYMQNFRNGGIYTIMMLPMPRRHVFFAYCTVGILGILMLWVVQILALFSSYLPVVNSCERAAHAYAQTSGWELPFSLRRSNGLFLSIMRSGLFHILLPMSWQEATISLLQMITLGCLPAYAVLGESKSFGSLSMLAALGYVLWTVNYRYGIMSIGVDVPKFIWSTALLGFITVYIALASVYRLNRDANLI